MFRLVLILVALPAGLALCALLEPSRALSADPSSDEVKEVIARLRSESLNASSDVRQRRLLVEIGAAQVGVNDLTGAGRSLELVQRSDSPGYDQLFKRFLALRVQMNEVNGTVRDLTTYGIPVTDRCDFLLAFVRSQFNARRRVEAKETSLAAFRAASAEADNQRSGYLLERVARLQVEMGFHAEARRTAEELQDKALHTSGDGFERARLLARAAFVTAKIGGDDSAKDLFVAAVKLCPPHSPASPGTLHLIAGLQAESGDFREAVLTANTIPISSGHRGFAFSEISLSQLAAGNVADAEQTASLIELPCDCKDRALIAVAKELAKRDDIANARRVTSRTSSEARRAEAMLEIASIVAVKGRKETAREIANSLTYPRDPLSRLIGKKPSFVFSFQKPETWGLEYEPGVLCTMAERSLGKEIVGDLTSSAMRCRILLDGEWDSPDPAAIRSWDLRKAAMAQAEAGDVRGALCWSGKLPEPGRALALIGIAGGCSKAEVLTGKPD